MTTAQLPIVPRYHSTFPGEPYLSVPLPNYQYERQAIIVRLIGATFLFFYWLPKKYVFRTVVLETESQAKVNEEVKPNGADAAVANGEIKKKKRRKNDKSNGKSKTDTNGKTEASTTSPAQEPEIAIEIDSVKSSLLTLSGLIVLFLILFLSPNNLFPSRTLLRAPLFTRQECQRLVAMAEEAAKRNAERAKTEKQELMKKFPELIKVEKEVSQGTKNETEVWQIDGWQDLKKLNSLLKSPPGWKKDRHNLYPTTDLNLVTDPFTSQDREWLASVLDARLSPLMERAYGVFRGAIRSNDIFVVRYDGSTEGQDRLRMHTDSSHLSFNVLLNEDFEGGGTRFHQRLNDDAIDVHPSIGETLLSHAMVLHEGLPTTSGTRYILVGFNSIDEKDPLTNQSTNLSIFSSWLNFSWMQVRFREGAERGIVNRRKHRLRNDENAVQSDSGGWLNNKYITSLFRDLDTYMTWLADKYAPLRSGKLIPDEKVDEYIQAMDQAMEERIEAERSLGIERSRANGYSSWFQGQNIHLDVFGGYASSWKERKSDEEKFRGENL